MVCLSYMRTVLYADMKEQNLNRLEPRILRMEIGEADAGKTIKEYLMGKVGFSSKQLSRFKYRRDGILLNGEKRYVTAVLQQGDVLAIRLTQGGEPVEENPHDLSGQMSGSSGYLPARDGRLQKIWAAPAAWLTQRYPLQILYEDQDILAVDKPSGIVCHPSPGHYDDTLSNQVADHLGRIGRELDVRVTGRLDKDTSGIVIFALNTETAAQLIRQRQAQMMDKVYIARVRGHFSDKKETGRTALADEFVRSRPAGCFNSEKSCIRGTVDMPLRRESKDSFRMITAPDGKAAVTHFRVLVQLEDGTSLVSCRIEHGRTHQIRVHMAGIGHPLVGDRLYGTDTVPPLKKSNCVARQFPENAEGEETPLMLHAWRAVLRQPFTGSPIQLEAPLPPWADRVKAVPDLADLSSSD